MLSKWLFTIDAKHPLLPSHGSNRVVVYRVGVGMVLGFGVQTLVCSWICRCHLATKQLGFALPPSFESSLQSPVIKSISEAPFDLGLLRESLESALEIAGVYLSK